ncbi:histidine kinase [Haladaptatus caseinilyticus]|uniref:histidine kinase n=1 Tax=Haladaptatus caseinilyticus TaxID=2993314 RepID=UPI00224B5E7A|nr:histidine kinase [Haladaptatus caseinilyticus]
MGTETATTDEVTAEQTSPRYGPWLGAVIAGLAGGVAMGILLLILSPDALTIVIPALYGLSGGIAGWFIHLSNSAIFGVIFAAMISLTSLHKYAESERASIGLGAIYGVVLWVLTGSIILPLWLQVVGVPAAPAVPTFALPSLVWHLAYGVVLGAVYPYVRTI